MSASPASSVADQAEKNAPNKEVKTWRRSTLVANTSRIMIGDHEELPIKGMQVHARVDGFKARVLMDLYFENPHDRAYEGTFKIRLPNEGTPYFFAFGQADRAPVPDRPSRPLQIATDSREPNISRVSHMSPPEVVRAQSLEPLEIMRERSAAWSSPKEARMVPREQAAFAYKSTVRRRVDPALVEWAGAGVFNARIFPIAPRGVSRVVIGYDIDLLTAGEDLIFSLPIPKDIPETAVDLEVAEIKGRATSVTPVVKPHRERSHEESREESRVFYRWEQLSGQEISVRIKGAGDLLLTGDDPQTGSYFAARVSPKLPTVQVDAQQSAEAVFLVDTSLSSNPERFPIWLKLLREILERNREQGLERFAVGFFNIETRWWRPKFMANTADNIEDLMSFAHQLALEGATDLGAALERGASPEWLASREASSDGSDAQTAHTLFLLSDGVITWGESDAFMIAQRLRRAHVNRLYAYRTGISGDDSAMLTHLTREVGGGMFSIVGEAEVAAASTAHLSPTWDLRDVEIEGGGDLMIAGRPQVIFAGQRLQVVGRGTPQGPLKLTLGRGDLTETIKLELSEPVMSPLTIRAYGQVAVTQLEEFLGFTDTFAEAYARYFRVTGKTTSLLMLENEEDYRRFGIRPQNDAGVIKASSARELIMKALKSLGDALGDAKFAFSEFTIRNQKLSDETRSLLSKLPARSFEVQIPPLKARRGERSGIDSALLAQLKQRKPEYDTAVRDARRRLKAQSPQDALKALSSLVEANPGDGALARDVGLSALEWGIPEHAYHLFRRVAHARPFEPQTFLALAQTLTKMKMYDLALLYYELTVQGEWNARFGSFKKIVTVDYIRFLRAHHAALTPVLNPFAKRRLEQLTAQINIGSPDLLVVISWNTDNTDVDLHVIEPSGEECYYQHKNTASGGSITQDVTRGYGPEMYVLPHAPSGVYKIRAKYFASNVNRASARTKVYVSVYRNWGRTDEHEEHKTTTLKYGRDVHDIFTIKVK